MGSCKSPPRLVVPSRILKDVAAQSRRLGFTLIELLVVVGIILALTGLVVATFRANVGPDRVRAAARQLQSAMLGARDRAISTYRLPSGPQPRGLRLIADPVNPNVVTGFSYIGPNDPWTTGRVILGRPDANNNYFADDQPAGSGTPPPIRTVRGYGTGWSALYSRGLLINGTRIRFTATGRSYTVDTTTSTLDGTLPEVLVLTTDFIGTPTYPTFLNLNGVGGSTVGTDGQPGTATVDDDGNGIVDDVIETGWPGSDDNSDIHAYGPSTTYSLDLAPSVLPNEQPIQLPSGVGIDLNYSSIPSGWGSSGAYINRMDILFSPRGTVVGSLGGRGIIHFLLAEISDMTLNRPPESARGSHLAVSLFCHTGTVASFPVDTVRSLGADGKAGVANTDDDNNGVTDVDVDGFPDPAEVGKSGSDDVLSERFYYAETGAVVGR